MSQEKKEFTEKTKCAHCGNIAPMEILKKHSQIKQEVEEFGESDAAFTISYEEGWIYDLLLCQVCHCLALQRTWYDDRIDDEQYMPRARSLYPAPDTMSKVLPENIRKEYDAALQVKKISANAYAVLLGRVLEVVCTDRKATGKSLSDKLADLAARGEIPNILVEMAHGLRQLRNVGAHADLGELTGKEIEVLDAIVKAILEYVYRGPKLVEEVKHLLASLTNTKTKPKP